MRPETGARMTWTLSSDRKIETRKQRIGAKAEPGWSTALPMLRIVPSAGAITRPSRAGTVRCGSLKKNTMAAVTAKPGQPQGGRRA